MSGENGTPMLHSKDKIPAPQHRPPVGEVPGVEDFLDETKDRMDQDPEATPYDDLRHYAYEGDGKNG